jgi:hypothetical protein
MKWTWWFSLYDWLSLTSNRLWQPIPIVGQIITLRGAHIAEAVREFLITFVLSILPLIVAGLYGLLFAAEKQWTFLIHEAVRQGDLFIYTTGMLGPLIYIVQKTRAQAPRFPHGAAFLVLSLVIMLLSAIGYALIRANLVSTARQPMNETFVIEFSMSVFVASALMFFLCLAYRNKVESGGLEEMKEEEDALTRALERHRQE